MTTLETTVHKFLDTLQSNVSIDQFDSRYQPSGGMHSMHDSVVESGAPPLTTIIRQPTQRVEIERLGKVYLTFCADQPLPLFPRDDFVVSLLARPDATLFGIVANALRYASDSEDNSHRQDSHLFRNAAHSKVMADIGHGDVELSTLQALCLVILFDFASTLCHFCHTAAPADGSPRWSDEDCIISHGTDFDACLECCLFDLCNCIERICH